MKDIGDAIGFDFMDQNMDQNDPANHVKVLVGKTEIESVLNELKNVKTQYSKNTDLTNDNYRMVNSYLNSRGISRENRIKFSQKIVETIYEILPSEQKYVTDKIGNVNQLDPVIVVREALERIQCQLDPAWYSWGTMDPKLIGENIRSGKQNLIESIQTLFNSELTNRKIQNFNQLSWIISKEGNIKYLADFINGKGINSHNAITVIMELMYNIYHMDSISSLNDKSTLNKIKSDSLELCKEYLRNNYEFNSRTEILFESIFQEAFTNNGKLAKIKNFDEIGILCDLIGFYEKYYGIKKAINELQKYFEIRNHADPIVLIKQLTQMIWGKTYTELLAESARVDKYMSNRLIEKLEKIKLINGKTVQFDKNELIGIVEGPNIEGNNLYYLIPGEHSYLLKNGYGLEHIVQNHFTDTQFKNWGINSYQELSEFLFDTLYNNPTGLFKPEIERGGGELIYKVNDKNGIERYLLLVFSTNRYLVTAYPVSNNKYEKSYNSNEYIKV